jgi:hypothetical protein
MAGAWRGITYSVMPALIAGIHVFGKNNDVDGRDKPGHDGAAVQSDAIML